MYIVLIGGRMKYSDIIDVQEFFKSAFDITSDKGNLGKHLLQMKNLKATWLKLSIVLLHLF